jgi:hypothetical protein
MHVTSHRASTLALLVTGMTAATVAQAASIGYVETLGGAISAAVSVMTGYQITGGRPGCTRKPRSRATSKCPRRRTGTSRCP